MPEIQGQVDAEGDTYRSWQKIDAAFEQEILDVPKR